MAYLSETNSQIYRRMLGANNTEGSPLIGVLPPGGYPTGPIRPTIPTVPVPPPVPSFGPTKGTGLFSPIRPTIPTVPVPPPVTPFGPTRGTGLFGPTGSTTPIKIPSVVPIPAIPTEIPIPVIPIKVNPIPTPKIMTLPGRLPGDKPKTIGTETVTPSSALVQAVYTPPTTTTGGRNFMPLVYIGGAGLLLYFLFKK